MSISIGYCTDHEARPNSSYLSDVSPCCAQDGCADQPIEVDLLLTNVTGTNRPPQLKHSFRQKEQTFSQSTHSGHVIRVTEMQRRIVVASKQLEDTPKKDQLVVAQHLVTPLNYHVGRQPSW
jgi:hypothetical protein